MRFPHAPAQSLMRNNKLKPSDSSLFNRQLAGLRAIAVTVVVLLHSGVPGFKGGYLGVDLFFVLSGYLITLSLIRARERGGQFLAEFYWHRFLRLFPALALLCAVVVVVGFFAGDEGRTRDVIASLTYVSNWTRALGTGTPVYLGHTWSLAIEEQFYLIWPVLLVVLLAVMRPARAAWWVAGLALALMIWRFSAAAGGLAPDRIYNGFEFRADGLLLGCALALATFQAPEIEASIGSAARRLVLIACVVMAGLFAKLDSLDLPMLELGYSISNISLVAIVAYFALPIARPRAVDALLGSRAMVWLGEISYGIYLWHYPIALYLYLRTPLTQSGWLLPTLLTVGGSIGLAALSFRFVEMPARSLRSWPKAKATLAGRATLVYSTVAFMAGVWFFFEGNIRTLVPGYRVQILAYGPHEVKAGVPFNVQPDGSSAIWISTNDAVTTNVRILFGEAPIAAVANGKSVTALVPAKLIPQSGTIRLSLIDGHQRPISDPITIVVQP